MRDENHWDDDRQQDPLTTHEVSKPVLRELRELQKGRTDFNAPTREVEGSVTLRIDVAETNAPLAITFSDHATIGRKDPIADFIPEIDLTSYGAYQMGISRRHAIIKIVDKTLQVTDLGGRNGTYLNGVRVLPKQSALLNDGDELRLGRIVLNIHVQPEAQ
jgi:pSer/pThr/pTyr-binding forkhead associated (FHA) protein